MVQDLGNSGLRAQDLGFRESRVEGAGIWPPARPARPYSPFGGEEFGVAVYDLGLGFGMYGSGVWSCGFGCLDFLNLSEDADILGLVSFGRVWKGLGLSRVEGLVRCSRVSE